MDSSDRKILAQEFSQVAYLAPSPKHDESADRLLQINKVLMYKIEKETGQGNSDDNSNKDVINNKDIKDTNNEIDNQKNYKNNDNHTFSPSEEIFIT
ncbi:hypothetical protein F8M41_001831 [Gigaspora margarita]|uniref:Uncharacterized protein n=1 Tax=Gigaspora margarita TaxID=4874 RepID=A0A8H4AYT2_GIGMA|nr:hypothetical protein F8M41_001831 [Gigaspora margarita]